jgi:hypothetical protein
MAMHYYNKTITSKQTSFACSGCGAVMAYYGNYAALSYGI